MSEQGTVSTSDTPQARDEISVVTEENQGDIPQEPSQATNADAKPAEDAGGSQNSDSGKSDSKKPKDEPSNSDRRAQRRNRRLEKELKAERQRNQQLTQTISTYDERLTALEQTRTPKPAKPRMQDFEDEDAYFDARLEWENSSQPDPAPKRTVDDTRQPHTPAPDVYVPDPEDMDDLMDQGQALFGDEFEEVLKDTTVPVSADMVKYIFESEVGAQLFMWADENREDATRIFKMRPSRMKRAMEAIEADLKKAGDSPQPATAQPGKVETEERRGLPAQEPDPNRRVSNAATPPGGSAQGVSTPAPTNSLADMSMEDYAKYRREQQRNR